MYKWNKPVQIWKATYSGTRIAHSSMHGLVYGTRNQHTTRQRNGKGEETEATKLSIEKCLNYFYTVQ